MTTETREPHPVNPAAIAEQGVGGLPAYTVAGSRLIEGVELDDTPAPAADVPPAPAPAPQPPTVPERWSSAFVASGVDVFPVGDGRQQAAVADVGPVGSHAEVSAFLRSLKAASASGRDAVMAKVRAAVDAVDSAVVDRMRASMRSHEADAEAAKTDYRAAKREVLAAVKRSEDPTEAEAAAEEARRQYKAAKGRAKLLAPELVSAEDALKRAKAEARRAVVRRLLAETKPAAAELARELGQLVADRLPKLAEVRGALEYLNANRD